MHVTHQSGKHGEILLSLHRGGVPVKERIIFYTTRQREEVG